MFKHSEVIQQPIKFNVTEVRDKLSNHDYHAYKDHFSSTFIKNVHKHSVGKALEPFNPDDNLSAALVFGDAFHEHMELGYLSDRFAIRPDGLDGRTKEGKEWLSENSHKLVLKLKDLEDIYGMSEACMALPLVNGLFEHPNLERRSEWSFFAEGDEKPFEGMKFRVRPDDHFVRKDTGMIEAVLDWKSCQDLSKLLKYGFFDLGYDIQAVFYCDVLGIDPRKFYFVCVEKSAPYSARVVTLSPDSIDRARSRMRGAMVRIADWQNNPCRETMDIDLPYLIEL